MGAAQETADATSLAPLPSERGMEKHHAGSGQGWFRGAFKDTERVFGLCHVSRLDPGMPQGKAPRVVPPGSLPAWLGVSKGSPVPYSLSRAQAEP